ncbi:oligosaccharide flippase family protein [Pseudoalteromonas sp. SR45-1]|uniref:lipopolysaccharide biosynthesis protein n=1 Tax=Pseudoalteromonas sp. SR45-1 TaxID=2760932 RepID=UPI001602CE25|nr:oligosaccharide flippase family protein [Pseudoalteromonas sp. SR45-1]MBB1325792.1 oligosaccharide flippase family protein [Pseudoalteromonas sp. SR45-1]
MSTFFRKTSIYFIANIINAAIPFLLLPILTRYLSVEEYGQIAMFQLLIAGLAGIIGLNTVGAAGRKFYDKGVSESELRAYNTSCLWVLFFSTLFIVLLTLIFDEELASILSISSDWIYFAIVVSTGSFIIQLRLNQWQIRGEAKRYGALQVGNSLLNLCASLAFVVLYSMGASGRIDALVTTSIIISIVALYFLVKNKLLRFSLPNKKNIIEALSFGVPLVPHVFGAFLLSSADRYVINDNLGLAAAGIYLLAFQLSSALTIVFDAINKSYVPWLFKNLAKEDDTIKLSIVKNTYSYFALLIFVALAGFFIGPLVVTFVAGKQFADASYIIGWLLLGQVFGGMYLMVTNYMFYSKQTAKLSFVTITCGLINVLLMFILVKMHGILGAAIAFSVSKGIQFFLTWVYAFKAVKMPWLYFYNTESK